MCRLELTNGAVHGQWPYTKLSHSVGVMGAPDTDGGGFVYVQVKRVYDCTAGFDNWNFGWSSSKPLGGQTIWV